MFRNRWPEWSGMGGRNGAEWVAEIKRNIHTPIEYDEHPIMAIRAALAMIKFLERFNLETEHKFNMRVGIHTGQVMAGVVGKERMQFDVFGDDVNIAARFESSSVNNRINVSKTTYMTARDHIEFEERGTISLKNKEDMKAYFVIEEK